MIFFLIAVTFLRVPFSLKTENPTQMRLSL